jgi:hypothetical protein
MEVGGANALDGRVSGSDEQPSWIIDPAQNDLITKDLSS